MSSRERSARALRDFTALFWLIAAVVTIIGRRVFPSADWVATHIVLLGALTHSAMVWSEYFARTLLKSPEPAHAETRQNARIVLLALGSLTVIVGYPAQIWPVVLAGAACVAIAILWHGAHLVYQLRGAVRGRWKLVVRYYIAAALMLPLGATLGVILAFGVNDEWRGRLIIAHMTFNLLGWIGLTVVGTLITFWAALVRARMAEHTERWARQALPVLVVGIIVTASGALIGVRTVAFVGVAMYAAGLIWWGRSLLAPVRSRGIREFAPASVGFAILWAFGCLVWLGVTLVRAGSWGEVTDELPGIGLVAAGGFAVQILIGALSYLLPAMMRGGPRVSVPMNAVMNAGATFRIAVPNLALATALLPLPAPARNALVVLAVLTLASFLPISVRSALVGVRAKRALRGGADAGE